MTDVLLALILVALAILLSRVQRLGLESELVVSVVRAIVQLGALTAVINVVFDHLGLAGVFLIVMLVAAAHTSGRRLTGIKGARVARGHDDRCGRFRGYVDPLRNEGLSRRAPVPDPHRRDADRQLDDGRVTRRCTPARRDHRQDARDRVEARPRCARPRRFAPVCAPAPRQLH